jgi:hypothetical protein
MPGIPSDPNDKSHFATSRRSVTVTITAAEKNFIIDYEVKVSLMLKLLNQERTRRENP